LKQMMIKMDCYQKLFELAVFGGVKPMEVGD
jgi:hypothetical protein